MTGVVAAVAAANGFKATASPDSVSGVGTQTGIVTVSVIGGAPPYTHEWIKAFGDDLTPQSPTGASTRFTGSPPSAEVFSAAFYDIVTDSSGRMTVSNTIAADLTGI